MADADGYSEHLQRLRHRKVSGIYAFIDAKTRKWLYIGESHTGRLYDTITRHFRAWKIGQGNTLGRRRGGTMYDRDAVLVCWAITDAKDAQSLQYAEIQRVRPRDNKIDGSTVVDPSGMNDDDVSLPV